MPAYNCERFVSKAIESILNQTYKNLELLIADDASKDDTMAIIERYSDARIKKFHNNTNQGYLVASNLLLEKAAGEYIVFQDADDFCTLDRIERLAEKLNEDKLLFAVGSNVITVNEEGKELSVSNFPTEHDEIYDHFSKYRSPIIGSALMFRKEILKTIGYYHPYFNRVGWEDYYWFSLIIQKYKVLNVGECLYYYRSNPASVSNQNKSPKSMAGFETIVYYMNQRKVGKPDDIALNNLQKANLMIGRFYISNKFKSNNKPSLKEIFFISDNLISTVQLWFFKIKLQFYKSKFNQK